MVASHSIIAFYQHVHVEFPFYKPYIAIYYLENGFKEYKRYNQGGRTRLMWRILAAKNDN